MSTFKRQVNNIDLEFDFDILKELAENNPDHFEEVRQEIISDFIQSLPEERRHRMECLQWRIDRTREKSKTALAACMAITEMMWESFEQLNTLFMEIKSSESNSSVMSSATLHTAKIIPFKTA